MKGFQITIRPEADGHHFEVTRRGEYIIDGWCRGTKKDARNEARTALEHMGLINK